MSSPATGARCRKCGVWNNFAGSDCSNCGDGGGGASLDVAPRAFLNSKGTEVAQITLSPGSGAMKSEGDEAKDLLAFVKSFVDDAPASLSEYTDGIYMCKLIAAIAWERKVNPRFNPRPKLPLQRLNNVHLAVTTMEQLGIVTAGINTKDVVDGNEKQIMSIIRLLNSYAKKIGAHPQPAQPPQQQQNSRSASPRASAGLSPLVITTNNNGGASSGSDRVSPAISPRGASPRTLKFESSPAPAGASLSSVDLLERENAQQEAALRELDAKIAAMNAKLDVLSTVAIAPAAATTPPATTTPPAKPEAASPVAVPTFKFNGVIVTHTQGVPLHKAGVQGGKTESLAAPISPRKIDGATPPPTTSQSPSAGGGGRVITVSGTVPQKSPPPKDDSSSTEGEDDSDDMQSQRSAQKSLDEKEAAAERLKQWKEEEAEKKRQAAEREAAAAIKTAQAGGAVPGSPPQPKKKRSKKVSKKKTPSSAAKPATPPPASPSTPAAHGSGSPTLNPKRVLDVDEEDEGISDSSDSESNPKKPSAGGSGTPPIPNKPGMLADKVKHRKKHRQRKERDEARNERLNAVEAELDKVEREAADLKAQQKAASGPIKEAPAATKAKDEAVVIAAAAPPANAAANSKWALAPARADALNKELGSNATFLAGLRRLQAVIRGKSARLKKKLLQKRSFIAREIIESEKTYVKNLGLCVDHFYNALRQPTVDFVDEQQVRQMFSELPVLRGYNAHFLATLEKRYFEEWHKSDQCLGSIFLGFVTYFRSYTSYVNNYNDATRLFYDLQRKNKAFQAFLAEKKVDPVLNGQELPAFLIMPIQRLPRYVMLLEDLLRNTPKDHADFQDLTAALAKVQEVADYVNERKREAENINAVIDVQSRLTGLSRNLAEAHRRFVRQGALMNVDGKGDTMLFLFNDILVTGKEHHGISKLAEGAKQALGIGKKGTLGVTPKGSRKPTSGGTSSPFFGRKKPQLQATDDTREYKFQRLLSLTDMKLSAVFNIDHVDTEKQHASHVLTVRTPSEVLNLGSTEEEDVIGWLHDVDTTTMRMVDKKRLRVLRLENERQKQHKDEHSMFLKPTPGSRVVNKAEASWSGKVSLRSSDGKSTTTVWACVLKPHLYVFEDNGSDEPLGWLYLLTSHAVLGNPIESGKWTGPFSFAIHVPMKDPKMQQDFASGWMSKFTIKMKGDQGLHHINSALANDKDAAGEEEVERCVYEFVTIGLNEALNWTRELRYIIWDSVKQDSDLQVLEQCKQTDEENMVCADCGGGPTTWASVSLGVFICDLCKAVHMEALGPQISVIRKVSDEWDISSSQRYDVFEKMGNAKLKAVYEKNAQRKEVPRAKRDDGKEARVKWIKAKYLDLQGQSLNVEGAGRSRRMSQVQLGGASSMGTPATSKLTLK